MLLKKQYDEDRYCVFVEDKEHEPILNIVKVYHDKIEIDTEIRDDIERFGSSAACPPFLPEAPSSFAPPFVKKKNESATRLKRILGMISHHS